ncbi:MAG: energy-coupling factor ABC transporter permease [Candidatus Gastranaerophilaceae bacterium]
MHLGNGIICPVTGIPMLVLAGAAAFYAFKKARNNFSKDKMMPAVTTLVFAMQMINFSIPMTGSSGHVVGGVLLAAILGPFSAFLAMCSILIVQSVFFADGGLLALGCNIFNMGFLACFVAYPFLYKPLADKNKPLLGAVLASVAALQFGSLAVVAEGVLSGSIQLSNAVSFAALMQLIHLPIGIAEGIVTAAVILIFKSTDIKKSSILFGGTAFMLAGFIAQYASQKPDGLEWALLKISDSLVLQTQGAIYVLAETIQSKTAIFSEVSSSFANIFGVIAVACIIYTAMKFVNLKAIKIDVK